ncbi:MAG TPA: aromatic ring-hydroxylating dioxygenase subunit alpha [Paracoccaceae bacterium]|nr:aromatic ring-hydroxylating dioxygenase subunit alpha [Paracoccaceae bacterium]
MYLKNCWYQAGWSNEVAPGQPLVRTLLDEPVLLWRDDAGEVHALLDMCPHRFVPLSAGKICDRTVMCGCHGLAFGVDGQCVDNPHGPVTRSMRVRAFPVMERHTAIWIWPGDPDLADPALLPDLSFIDTTPEQARITGYMPTAADYRLLTDNIMDLSHADYVHPTSLGGVMTSAKATSRYQGDTVVARWEAFDCEPIPAARSKIPAGSKADFWIEVNWHAPALMVLSTATTVAGSPSGPADQAGTLHNIVPESEGRAHYFFCSVRGFMIDDPAFSAYLEKTLRHAFENEDKPMLEAQQQRVGNRDFWALKPLLLKTDAAAVMVRRKLEALIESENA